MEKITCIDCGKCHYDNEGWVCEIHDTEVALLVDDGGDGKKSYVTPLLCIDFEPLKLDTGEEGYRCSLCGNNHGYDNPLIGLLGLLDTDYNFNDIYLCNVCERKVYRDAALNDMDFMDALKANLDDLDDLKKIREWNLKLLENSARPAPALINPKDGPK